MINIHEPKITLSDKIEMIKSLSTNWIGKGKKVDQFQDHLKKYLNLDNIVTVTSGTQALYEIFRLLKTKTNKKEIIISPISFIGIASSIKINDFEIKYADIDLNDLSLSLNSIKEKINHNTAAVVIQHYGGRPNREIQEISDFLKQKNIYLIEDCATVLGGKINNQHLGRWGDFSIWSFDSVKIITTLDGGAIYCKNKNDLSIIENNIHFGLIDSPTTMLKFNQDIKNWWEIQPQRYGTKNILNNITASLGISQLKKIDFFINKQKDVWNYYQDNIKNSKIILPQNPINFIDESYFLFWILSDKRNELAWHLKQNNIFSTFRYYPLHKTSLYGDNLCKLPNTEQVYNDLLCIPCHKNLTKRNLKHIVNIINNF